MSVESRRYKQLLSEQVVRSKRRYLSNDLRTTNGGCHKKGVPVVSQEKYPNKKEGLK